jgi:hypothetical protein
MLCYAMLCYAMLCYAMLCYAMLCYAMLCYAMLCRCRRFPANESVAVIWIHRKIQISVGGGTTYSSLCRLCTGPTMRIANTIHYTIRIIQTHQRIVAHLALKLTGSNQTPVARPPHTAQTHSCHSKNRVSHLYCHRAHRDSNRNLMRTCRR